MTQRRLKPTLQAAFIPFLLIGPVCAAAASQNAAPCSEQDAARGRPQLHIVVSGARREAGNITYTLYGQDSGVFLKPHGALAVVRVMLSGTTTEACLSVTAPGAYAAAVYHDENNNHHFDKNFLGLPAEGYGFSNDAPTLFGPPSFKSVQLMVHPGDNRISIHLRY